MKVKDCRECPMCVRRVWSAYYAPKGYHPIGMSHAYAWCTLSQKRVRDIKQCRRQEQIIKQSKEKEITGE